MKKTIYSLLSILLLGACNFLDVEPTLSISQESAILNRADLDRAMTGSYDALQGSGLYGRQLVILPDLLSPNLSWGGTTQDYGEFDNHSLSVENTILLSVWNTAYDGINRVNNILYRLPGLNDLTENERLDYEAEARFIRALNYFHLSQLFAGVPLRSQPTMDATPESLDAPRATLAEVQAFIAEDLNFAIAHLSKESASYTASVYAAKALMAKLYLLQGNAEAAWTLCNEIIENGPYQLEGNYADLFTSGGVSKEGIFSIQFNPQDKSDLANYFIDRKEILPADDFIAAYEDGDLRKSASINDRNLVVKYPDLTTGADNVYVLRLGDIHLLRAEAEAGRANPDVEAMKADLNLIRQRAGVSANTQGTVAQVYRSIATERLFELAFEGHAWYDLLRNGYLSDAIPGITEPQRLMPIPLDELNTNNAITETDQNPGY